MSKEDKPLVEIPLTENAECEENSQLTLAALASIDNQGARKKIVAIVQPLIDFQTDCFCKRFCEDNHRRYRCSLPDPIKHKSSVSSGANARVASNKNQRDCEWGKASAAWMLDYLTNKQRLLKFTNRHGDNLYDYFFQIINSLTFFKRWKAWRLGSTVTPLAIQNMGPTALAVFKSLQQQRKLRFIAEQNKLPLSYVKSLVEEIFQCLGESNHYHALQLNLQPEPITSIAQAKSEQNNESQVTEEMCAKTDVEKSVADNLALAWNNLSVTEQFVIEAMTVNHQPEETVLYALQTMDIRLKEGVLPEDTTTEMLHDFKTDSLLKLGNL